MEYDRRMTPVVRDGIVSLSGLRGTGSLFLKRALSSEGNRFYFGPI